MNKDRYAVITGDIVNSRKQPSGRWLPILEAALQEYSEAYDIYRGDSFQALMNADKVFEAVFYLKAVLKSLTDLDVRIGIGLGEVEKGYDHIKNAEGTALLRSGEAFDNLGKETLQLVSQDPDLDSTINLLLKLSTEITNRWTENMASTIAFVIKNPKLNQLEIAEALGKKHQSQISTELRKGGYHKIMEVIRHCTQLIIK